MELLVCGTAAAEGWPAMFCPCEVCEEARRRGGKEVRSRAAYQLGETIRIDFGPDSHWHSQRYGLRFERLRHLLVTHAHQDHWEPQELMWRRRGFAQLPDDAELRIYGNAAVGQRLRETLGDDLSPFFLTFREIHPEEPLTLDEGVTVIPIRAAHDPGQVCLNFLLQTAGPTVLIGHDTGWYSEDTWAFLSDFTLDVVLLDSTSGPIDTHRGHLGCPWVVRAWERLGEQGSLAFEARFIATHFSHNGGWLHTDLEEYYHPHGIEVAYDGLKVEL